MYLTGRFVALLLLGAVPTIIVPEYYVVALWIIGALVLAGVDFLAAGSTGALRIVRRPTDPIRLGESTSSTLIVETGFATPGSRRRGPPETGMIWTSRAGSVSRSGPASPPRDAATALRCASPSVVADRWVLPAASTVSRCRDLSVHSPRSVRAATCRRAWLGFDS